jgi:hypothetical protein
MLAPLAIIALLIGGTQTAIMVSDEEGSTHEPPQLVQVEAAYTTQE